VRRPRLRTGLGIGVFDVADLSSGRRLGEELPKVLARRTARLRRLDDVLGGGDTVRRYLSEYEMTKKLVAGGSLTVARVSGTTPQPGRLSCQDVIVCGRHRWVRPRVLSGSGIWPRFRYELTVPTWTPRYSATSDVVHHSASGSGLVTYAIVPALNDQRTCASPRPRTQMPDTTALTAVASRQA